MRSDSDRCAIVPTQTATDSTINQMPNNARQRYPARVAKLADRTTTDGTASTAPHPTERTETNMAETGRPGPLFAESARRAPLAVPSVGELC